MGILYVHHLVADVVGSLHNVHKRVARIAQRLALARKTQHAKFGSHLLEISLFRLKKAEFSLSGKR